MYSQSVTTVVIPGRGGRGARAWLSSRPRRAALPDSQRSGDAPELPLDHPRHDWPRVLAVLLLSLLVLLALFGKRFCSGTQCGWTVGQAQFSSPANGLCDWFTR